MAGTRADSDAAAHPAKTGLAYLVGVLLGFGLVASIVPRDLAISVRGGSAGVGGFGFMLGVGIVLFLAILLGTFVVWQVFALADR